MSYVKNQYNRITIDKSGYPAEVLINGEKYELLCEYDASFNKDLIKIYVKTGGSDVVVDYGNDTACIGYYSVEPGKINDLFEYIEATVSLKSGFDLYSEDLKKYLDLASDNGKKYPIIRSELENKSSIFFQMFNRIYQNKVFNDYFSKPFAGVKGVYEVEYTESVGSEKLEQTNVNDLTDSEEMRAVETAANNLPDGWRWVQYVDGSGRLESPNGESYFSYDLHTSYTALGAIEYQKSRDVPCDYDAFWGNFDEFKEHAEDVIRKEFCCLGKFNIPEIMNGLSDNAWYGREPTTVCIVAGDNVIEMEGYTFEPSYESFSATSSISLNGQVLYGLDSRNVEAYRNEVYLTGIYNTLNQAVAHIEERVRGQELVLISEPSRVDSLIAGASARVEQNVNVNDIKLNERDIVEKE